MFKQFLLAAVIASGLVPIAHAERPLHSESGREGPCPNCDSADALKARWSDLEEVCRGPDMRKSATACAEQELVVSQLKQQNLCLGYKNQIHAMWRWHPCNAPQTGNSFDLDRQPPLAAPVREAPPMTAPPVRSNPVAGYSIYAVPGSFSGQPPPNADDYAQLLEDRFSIGERCPSYRLEDQRVGSLCYRVILHQNQQWASQKHERQVSPPLPVTHINPQLQACYDIVRSMGFGASFEEGVATTRAYSECNSQFGRR